MGKLGTLAKPQYETQSGALLVISPIGSLIVRRWDIEYRKAHPMPTPPTRVLSDPAQTPYEDKNDTTYLADLAKWDAEYQQANTDFLFRYGIESNPPDGWVCPYPVGDGIEQKVLWLESILMPQDLAELPNVILGVLNVTAKGLEEAEKN